MVALGGVVVDHIHDHFDTGGVQGLDQVLEFVETTAGGIAWIGGEVADGIVAPVVFQSSVEQMTVVDESLYRQELHRGDAQALEVVDDRRRAQPGIGAAHFGRNMRVQAGEALDVQLIDDGLMPGNIGRAVPVPIKAGIDHLALEHAGRAVAAAEAQILAGAADAVTELGIAPLDGADNRFGVGVQQQLVRIEAVSLLRPIRTMDPVAVQLARTHFRQIGMPDLVGLLAQLDALLFLSPAVVKQAQLDLVGVLGEQGEIDSLSVPGGAQGIGFAGPDGRHQFFRHGC
jgi:hypothetical protein